MTVCLKRMTLSRRRFLGAAIAGAVGTRPEQLRAAQKKQEKAQIAITFDLEMSRHYPRRGMVEWDYQKGNLDQATKDYSVAAAKIARDRGVKIHFFCVGRVLEQANIKWLQQIAADGHSIGNHTYDHVNLLARTSDEIQFRFSRAPWLIAGRSIKEVLRENIRLTSIALEQRVGIKVNGFRTPGGFSNGLGDRPDLQQMLLDQGFTWVSSKYPRYDAGRPQEPPTEEHYANIVRAQSEAQPFRYPSGLVEIPMSPISDTVAFRSLYWELEYFLKANRLAVEWAIAHRGVFDMLCHPSVMVVEDPEHETIKMICELVRDASDRAEPVGLDQIKVGRFIQKD